MVFGKPLILPAITNSTRGWPRLGLPTLLTAGEREQVGTWNEAQAKNIAMHLCVCLITLILPPIICNLSNLALYRLLALLQDSFTETRDEQCACCIRDEHTCGLYLIH